MADTVGVLNVRLDVEAGTALEHLARLERELDEIKADYHNIIRKCNTAEWERDEARKIAAHLMRHSVDCWSYQAELIEAYPWMKDTQ